MEIVIKATTELTTTELLTVLAARVRVFVVEQQCAYQEVDASDFAAQHVMLMQAGQLVAYARIIPHADGQHISFGRVLVVKEYRGRHYGRQLVAAVLAEIHRTHPQAAIKIQAQNYLRDFYASFGFQPVSAVYLDDGIPHIDMLLPA
ncbi:GNAT family N-acetyltransferase [Lacticaseibacillus baoqingensis]|uniref:GNAT family N-acetyltransferase n=1 Tax=Lacticaseibacillus baoqingensis TaxID=2486013 RepID=A0ABW4E2P0_9LACO|nr:GNAT family N-acetyltransferase [Lacticaseibacillus baoqingensis]